MEVEVKFRIGGREDLLAALQVLRCNGMDFVLEGEERYADVYYDPGDGGALRYRFYGDGRVVRTYKRDLRSEDGVKFRVEEEESIPEDLARAETSGKTPQAEMLTKRERYRWGDLVLTYDLVRFAGDLQMAFLEVEGPEEDVKRVANLLKKKNFQLENRSKIEIALDLKRGGLV